jgi:hypothetical protein
MRCYSLFRNFAPPFALEQVGMESTACFPTNENVFTPLRAAKIVFDLPDDKRSGPYFIDDYCTLYDESRSESFVLQTAMTK